MKLWEYGKTILFLTFSLPFWIFVVAFQTPGLALLLVNRKIWRWYMRLSQDIFCLYLIAATKLFSPTTLYIYGEYDDLDESSFVTCMSNHQVAKY